MRSICRRIFLCDWAVAGLDQFECRFVGRSAARKLSSADLMNIWGPGADRQELAEAKTVAALQ
jgi:hypothetical protein